MTLNTATADSVNTAFVRLSNAVTYKDVMATVNKLGITDKNAQGLNANARLTLGISAVTPARMASAYSAFANNGSQYPLIEVKEIKNSNTGLDWQPNAKPTQVLDPNVAETVTQTLTHVTHDQGATAYGATTLAGMDTIAGKTGTSTMDMTSLKAKYPDIYSHTRNGYFTTAAAWFNGYTPKLEAAVAVSRWINETDPATGKKVAVAAPVDNINGAGFSFGGSVSLPIWAEFMKLMQGSGSKQAGDPAFPTPNTSGMTIMNSPSASASASPSTAPSTANPGGGVTQSASPTPSPSPSSSPTCAQLFGLGCNGGGTPTSGTGTSGSPSATRTKTAGPGGNG
jgi:membrane peptidoglycan carboxypeptidase